MANGFVRGVKLILTGYSGPSDLYGNQPAVNLLVHLVKLRGVNARAMHLYHKSQRRPVGEIHQYPHL
jgi:hypothetical protein